MMLSASPAAVTRSSLEEMLDSLRRRDEALENSKDLPPALPARPASRARLPSARHSLPTDFKVGSNGQVESKVETRVTKVKEYNKRKEKELGYKSGSFGSKKMRKDQNCVDSNPYVEENNEKAKGPVTGSVPKGKEPEWDDNIGYFIKKQQGYLSSKRPVVPILYCCTYWKTNFEERAELLLLMVYGGWGRVRKKIQVNFVVLLR